MMTQEQIASIKAGTKLIAKSGKVYTAQRAAREAGILQVPGTGRMSADGTYIPSQWIEGTGSGVFTVSGIGERNGQPFGPIRTLRLANFSLVEVA